MVLIVGFPKGLLEVDVVRLIQTILLDHSLLLHIDRGSGLLRSCLGVLDMHRYELLCAYLVANGWWFGRIELLNVSLVFEAGSQ